MGPALAHLLVLVLESPDVAHERLQRVRRLLAVLLCHARQCLLRRQPRLVFLRRVQGSFHWYAEHALVRLQPCLAFLRSLLNTLFPFPRL